MRGAITGVLLLFASPAMAGLSSGTPTWRRTPSTSDTSNSVTAAMIMREITTDTPGESVFYFFWETAGNAGGSSSGWQADSTFIDESLTPSTLYTWQVIAKSATSSSAAGSEYTAWSTPQSYTTTAAPTAPTFADISIGTIGPDSCILTLGTAPAPERIMWRISQATSDDSLSALDYSSPTYYGYGDRAYQMPDVSSQWRLKTIEAGTDTAWITSAADAGAGTLRSYLEADSGLGKVLAFDPTVFTTPTVISLASPIAVRTSSFILDGTAHLNRQPTAEITLTRSAAFINYCDTLIVRTPSPAWGECGLLAFQGDSLFGRTGPGSFDSWVIGIIRGLRIDHGGDGGAYQPSDADGVELLSNTAGKGVNGVIFDRCTFGEAGDEAIAYGFDTRMVTVQYCIVKDNVKGIIIGGGTETSSMGALTFVRNFMWLNGERNPYAGSGLPPTSGTDTLTYEIVNNVAYDWYNKGATYLGSWMGDIVGNTYLAGPSTDNRTGEGGARIWGIRLTDGVGVHADTSLIYLSDNRFPAETVDDDLTTYRSTRHTNGLYRVDPTSYPNADTPILARQAGLLETLSQAGAPIRSSAESDAIYLAWAASQGTGVLKWDTAMSDTVRSLTPNSKYWFEVRSCTDCKAIKFEPSAWTESDSIVTLAAVPPAVLLGSESPTTIDVRLAPDTNPAWTEYAIQVGSQWVQANGTLGASKVWQTKAVWGETTVTGLTKCLSYTVSARSRNILDTETANGSTATVRVLCPLESHRRKVRSKSK